MCCLTSPSTQRKFQRAVETTQQYENETRERDRAHMDALRDATRHVADVITALRDVMDNHSLWAVEARVPDLVHSNIIKVRHCLYNGCQYIWPWRVGS